MAASVPVFHLCDKLLVGFERPESTGPRLRAILKPWTAPAIDENDNESDEQHGRTATTSQSASLSPMTLLKVCAGGRNGLAVLSLLTVEHSGQTGGHIQAATPEEQSDALPLPGDDLPLPGIDAATEGAQDTPGLPLALEDDEVRSLDDQIDVPLFGRLSASKLGMPLFTLAIGLVDGFNPCAMWVLLFLLSILVNLKDRRRILAIAGTFVFVSGLAYFAFMAAWLNVFMLIGYLRAIQVGLALMAIAIGAIHVKDFFAFRKGISLSIPETAKPGIYARVRKIVMAEHLMGAIIGAMTLAVLVNLIELLCTAGLPALYTNVLVQQGYSSATKYAYLLLYIAAYMFDDSLMVAVVVLTLSHRKLQESQGRWLKLISGSAILLLGVVMLFRPEWLQ